MRGTRSQEVRRRRRAEGLPERNNQIVWTAEERVRLTCSQTGRRHRGTASVRGRCNVFLVTGQARDSDVVVLRAVAAGTCQTDCENNEME